MRMSALALLITLGFGLGCSGGKGPTGDPKVREQRATNLVVCAAAGDFENARQHFNLIMGLGLSVGKFKQVWNGLEKEHGKFSKQAWVNHTEQKGYEIVWVGLQFEGGTLKAKVVFDSSDKVTGLFFQPWYPKWKAPKYVDEAAFTEVAVKIGAGRWELPGTLTLPGKVNAPPAIVLVHGSGPHDRDETIGPNKPFKDLAWGLASKGIAVLRYEKRTKEHQMKMAKEDSFTMHDETVEDAILAVRLLQQRDDVDSTNIYIMGHSQGGYCAPRIAKGVSGLAGFISLAGNSRPLEDLIIEQTEYLSEINPDQVAALKNMRLAAERVKKLTASDADRRGVLLGAPVSYWLDLRDYDSVATAKEFGGRILILHGERDYQVGLKDLQGWTNGLAGKEGMGSKVFTGLNHLMMPGEGASQPAEYNKAGHVDSTVIDTIADWINDKR